MVVRVSRHCADRTACGAPLIESANQTRLPELEYLEAKWAAHLPYRQATNMLKEVLPLDKGISSSGIRDPILDPGKELDADIERDIAQLPSLLRTNRLANALMLPP